MVQQVITSCDVCYADGKNAPADSYAVGMLGGTWSLDLCEAHRAALIDPLADVAERLGQVVKAEPRATSGAPGRKRGPKPTRPLGEPCLVCAVTFKNSTAATVHYQKAHGIDGLGGAYGLTCPLCSHEGGSATAIASHVRREHPEVAVAADGQAGMPEAFRYAAEHGDPHGVVAKVLANHGLDALPKAAS